MTAADKKKIRQKEGAERRYRERIERNAQREVPSADELADPFGNNAKAKQNSDQDDVNIPKV